MNQISGRQNGEFGAEFYEKVSEFYPMQEHIGDEWPDSPSIQSDGQCRSTWEATDLSGSKPRLAQNESGYSRELIVSSD
jgi:hypothetical protein